MNYEEKYKQALKRARQFSEHPLQEDSAYIAEYIFPELVEGEEEKIRKDIISYLRNEKIVKRYISDIEIDKWIAWLEKQKPNTNKREIDDAYLQGICDAKHAIEKHGGSPRTNIEIPFGANIEPRKLYADAVIAWLVANICDYDYYVKLFKKDFGI